jgi:hypothetical protein
MAAAIRVREPERTKTWGASIDRALFAPLQMLGSDIPQAFIDGVTLVDTDANLSGADAAHAPHPGLLLRRAYHLIQGARERMEHALIYAWIQQMPGTPLLADGSISRLSGSHELSDVAGLVKSHRTMYLRPEEVQCVLALQAGERSSAFRVESRGVSVASWYLKLRRDAGSDPLWGLVRVEIPIGTFSRERADRVSRGVLAETAPVSLPDARWDRLLYGIRDCEMFLAAVM